MRNIKLYYVPNNQFKSRTRSRALALVFFMNYRKVYKMLVDNRLANPLPKGVYGEVHHIVPKAEGGSDDSTNLVKLTGREHYIAHLLLAKIYDDYKMYSALTYMRCGNKLVNRDFKFNSRLYEKMRIKFGKKFSEHISGENHPNFGKHLSRETRARISKSNIGKKRSQEQKNKISEATKKALTPKVIAKMSASLKGRKVWNKGLYGYSTAKKGTHLSDDTKTKISKSITGSRWWNNGVVERQAKECPLGFVAGRLKKKRSSEN